MVINELYKYIFILKLLWKIIFKSCMYRKYSDFPEVLFDTSRGTKMDSDQLGLKILKWNSHAVVR